MYLSELLKKKKANQAALNKLIETASAQADGWTDEQRKERDNLKASIEDLKVSIASMEEEEAETAAAQKIVTKAIDAPNPETAGAKTPVIEVTKAEEPKFESFGEFVKCAVEASKRNGNVDERLIKLNNAQTAAGDTRLLKDGAFMIPKPQAQSILETSWDVGPITSMIPKTPISVGNALHYLEFDDKDLSGGSAAAGMQVAWFDEGEDLTETAFKMSEKTLNLKEVGAYVVATDNMLDDAPAFESTCRRLLEKQLSYEVEKKALYGTGTNSPKGMIASTNQARILIAKETQAQKLCTENFNKMYAAFPDDLIDKAVWVIQPSAKAILPDLNNAAGTKTAVYTGPMMGYDQKQIRPTILGIPVVFHNAAKALGSEGDCALLAPSEYTMITKGGLKVDMSIHVQFLKGKVVLRFRMRINGMPSWSAPLTLENGGHKLSPYVVLAGGR